MTVVTVTLPKCERCEKTIEDPSDGFIIAGDIYVARVNKDGQPDGGIVGANFPTPSEEHQAMLESSGEEFHFTYDQVNKQCFCKDCLMTILDLHPRLGAQKPVFRDVDFEHPEQPVRVPRGEEPSFSHPMSEDQ